MKIKWYGHAAFLITSAGGTKIITDPYESGAFGGQISYAKIKDQVDLVSVSHEHNDHNDVKNLPGSPQIIRGAGSKTVKGIKLKGIPTYHDPSRGSQRGTNTIFTFLIDEIRVCHLGDLGHILGGKELVEIGPVDILLTPVGGYFTIDAEEATRISEQIQPKVLIPMHFKTPKCALPISAVDEFLKGKEKPKRPNTSEVAFDKETLPQKMEIVVLEHAL
jgi:L-ascorbate metabolism protein UlaG (beta-lactamase superfamily)